MTIALDPNRRFFADSALKSAVVPPAAVWEPGAEESLGLPARAQVSRIRTLRPDIRTVAPKGIPGLEGANARKRGRFGADLSNTGNYLLGSVFGAAVFFGTVFGGLLVA